MAWRFNASEGLVVAGGSSRGSGINQLNQPTDVIFDKKHDSLIICDKGNERIVRWSRQTNKTPDIIIPNIDCWSLIMDNDRNLYVSCYSRPTIRRYGENDSVGTVLTVLTTGLNNTKPFKEPTYIFVNGNHTVYVSDWGNHQVIKQMVDVQYNSIIAGGYTSRNSNDLLTYPQGLFVDHMDNLYVVDGGNDRVMRWCKGCKTGEKIVGNNGRGNRSNQLHDPKGLAFDQKNNFYVVDKGNHRVQRFYVDID